MPRGMPMITPVATTSTRLPGDARADLATGEPPVFWARLSHAGAQSNRRSDSQPKRNGHPDRKSQGLPEWRAPHRAIVNDLRRILHAQHRDGITLTRVIGHRRELGVPSSSGFGHDGESLFRASRRGEIERSTCRRLRGAVASESPFAVPPAPYPHRRCPQRPLRGETYPPDQ